MSDCIFGECQPINVSSANLILNWRYNVPYNVYNLSSANDAELQNLLDPDNLYYTVHDKQNQVTAYYCFGRDARVPGGNYREDALDFGGGMRPDLTGQKLGLQFIETGLAFARSKFKPFVFRVTVAAFNKRALRLCRNAGFTQINVFKSEQNSDEFVVLTREA